MQRGHLVPCDGYHAPLISTGYDSVIGHRTSGLFCVTAKQNGKVEAVTSKSIIVKYADGNSDHIQLGRIFGKAAGLNIPHDIRTDLKVGEKFTPGDAIAYHSGFFQKDWLNPRKVVFKSNRLVRTVLWEADTTFEDASVLSRKTAQSISTRSTKVKDITVSFHDHVSELIKPGTVVDYDSVLCIIQDKVTAEAGVFDEKTLQTLKMFDAQTPKAGVVGSIDKIEFFYHGMIEDLSKPLRSIADKFNSDLKSSAKELNKPIYTGQVDGSLRIQGDALALDTACIRIYITSEVEAGVGDKGVFCNQMKSVFSQIAEEDYTTQDGRLVDAIFGGKSIQNRIVNSPYIIGTTNSILMTLGEAAVKVYEA